MFVTSLRDLEVRHLIALDAVATEGTFGRAAERLGYTQSAISQQIAALERLVDGKLFDRPGGPRPVELTPLGAEVLDAARDLLNRVEAAGQRIDIFAGVVNSDDRWMIQAGSRLSLTAESCLKCRIDG